LNTYKDGHYKHQGKPRKACMCLQLLPAEDPQCLQQELHALDEHQPIDSHEELEDHQSGLAEELS